jgi:hypothetical protein
LRQLLGKFDPLMAEVAENPITGNNDSEVDMSVAGLLLTCRPERNSIASTLHSETLAGPGLDGIPSLNH